MGSGPPQSRLNSRQLDAATRLWSTPLKALQVVAGAGSGKTSTLIAAVEEAARQNFQPQRMAILTFSRRAAHELRDRLEVKNIRVGYCGTIHALAYRLLKDSGRTFSILKDSAALRASWLRQRHPHFEHLPTRVLARREFLTGDDASEWNTFFESYLFEHALLDFDSLVTAATRLPGLTGRFETVFVDVFQDTSPDQADFIRSLNAAKYFVVGDDWQSIYAFRGADVSLTRNFKSLFAGSDRVFLLHNYRSARHIVKLGNRAIRLSGDFVKKRLKATRSSAAKPVFFFARAETAGAVWQKFLNKYLSLNKLPGVADLTVLVRTNALRRLIEAEAPEGLQVMTIHKSKGLEFDNVIVFGIAENSMPHRDNVYDEEVRLLYVAMTRARHFLGFVGWENGQSRSKFIPFLMRHCRLIYL
jgi:superfamily I DNA/RNA helicase